ncbi:MAG: hypothetical protein OEV77_14840 [Nitrospira sp.]|nr:hypothetical protein [Nitrospira sp.]
MADDGYSTSQVATVTVNVSDAPLVKLDFQVRQPRLDARHSMTLELVGNFTDEQNVALPASYLQFHSTNPASGIVTLHERRFTAWRTAPASSPPPPPTVPAASRFKPPRPRDRGSRASPTFKTSRIRRTEPSKWCCRGRENREGGA